MPQRFGKLRRDDDTSIKVSRQTRERLARLAAERGTTLKDVVEELAAATLTAAELAEREHRARDVLAEHFGIEVADPSWQLRRGSGR